jgi:hypothetical protein
MSPSRALSPRSMLRSPGHASRCAPTWTACRSPRRRACPTRRSLVSHACGHDGHPRRSPARRLCHDSHRVERPGS